MATRVCRRHQAPIDLLEHGPAQLAKRLHVFLRCCNKRFGQRLLLLHAARNTNKFRSATNLKSSVWRFDPWRYGWNGKSVVRRVWPGQAREGAVRSKSSDIQSRAAGVGMELLEVQHGEVENSKERALTRGWRHRQEGFCKWRLLTLRSWSYRRRGHTHSWWKSTKEGNATTRLFLDQTSVSWTFVFDPMDSSISHKKKSATYFVSNENWAQRVLLRKFSKILRGVPKNWGNLNFRQRGQQGFPFDMHFAQCHPVVQKWRQFKATVADFGHRQSRTATAVRVIATYIW